MAKTAATNAPTLYEPLGGSARQYRHTQTGAIISRRQYLTLQRGVSPEAYAAERQQPRAGSEDVYHRVTQRMRAGESFTQATKAEGVSPETIKRLNREHKTIFKEYDQAGRFKRYQVGGEHGTFYVFTADGEYIRDVPLDAKNLSIMGQYWDEVQNAEFDRPHRLSDFENVTVRDIDGNKYQLLTDINAIQFVKQSMSDSDAADFEQHLYKKAGWR